MKKYTLKNEHLEIDVVEVGGAISDILFDGEPMVLSYANDEDYLLDKGPFLNAMVGPVAGRIKDGKTAGLTLTINNGTNHLHGGTSTIAFKNFDLHQVSDTKLIASLTTNHDEDGYHGNYHYQITYTLEENSLILEFDYQSEVPSPLFGTCHFYFTLAEDSARKLTLTSPIEEMMALDETCAPVAIVKSPFNFKDGLRLEDAFNMDLDQYQYSKNLDHPFIVNGPITLEGSRYAMDVTTDQKVVVLYGSNYIDDSHTFKQGKGYEQIALALETQDIPNGINLGLSKPTNHYTQKTSYCFRRK